MNEPLLQFDRSLIEKKREEVASDLMGESKNVRTVSFKSLSSADIRLLYEAYDRVFFGGWYAAHVTPSPIFSLSRRMTSSAGKTIFDRSGRKPFEIRMAVDMYFNHGLIGGEHRVNGLLSRHALEALQLVLEHEMCHVAEHILYGTSDCKRERFMQMAGAYFGHLGNNHALPTDKTVALHTYQLKIGDKVQFVFRGEQMQGILYKAGKTATVLVSHPAGMMMDREGNRYAEFRVSFPLLKSTLNA